MRRWVQWGRRDFPERTGPRSTLRSAPCYGPGFAASEEVRFGVRSRSETGARCVMGRGPGGARSKGRAARTPRRSVPRASLASPSSCPVRVELPGTRQRM